MSRPTTPIDLPVVRLFRQSADCRRFFRLLQRAQIITNDGAFHFDLLCVLQECHDISPGLPHREYFDRVAMRFAYLNLSERTVEDLYHKARRGDEEQATG